MIIKDNLVVRAKEWCGSVESLNKRILKHIMYGRTALLPEGEDSDECDCYFIVDNGVYPAKVKDTLKFLRWWCGHVCDAIFGGVTDDKLSSLEIEVCEAQSNGGFSVTLKDSDADGCRFEIQQIPPAEKDERHDRWNWEMA